MSKVWKVLGEFLYKYIGTLFMDVKNGKSVMSIGRVLLIGLSIAAIYLWVYKEQEIPGTMSTFLLVIAGYVLGTKVTEAIKSFSNKG